MSDSVNDLLKNPKLNLPPEIANFIVEVMFQKRESEEDFQSLLIKHISNIATAAIVKQDAINFALNGDII